MDFGPARDVGFMDAGSPDLPVLDMGPPPAFPFTGVFGILNTPDALVAQEVDGVLMAIVGRPPYIYVGTISEGGDVDLTSHVILRSGCGQARLTGIYDRVNAVFELTHTVCSEDTGLPVTSMIRGGFGQDFDPGASGIYELTATPTPVGDPGCYMGGPQSVRYGVSSLADGTVIIFTAHDLIEEPAVYIGQPVSGGGIQTALPVEGHAFSAFFEQVTANDPLRMTGERDVFQPQGPCFFRIVVEGERVSLL